jgi:Aspartyl protease
MKKREKEKRPRRQKRRVHAEFNCMSIGRVAVYVLALLTVSLPAALAAEAPSTASTIHFRVISGWIIVLPVKVNGAGPFDFVLDTGTSETVIDSALAAQLHLPLTGSATTILFPAKPFAARMAKADELEVEGARVKVSGFLLLSLEGLRFQDPKVRGIIGEDFLKNFDLLLDNHRQVLRMERGPGLMTALAGEHVPLSGQGKFLGEPTHNRLILTLKIPDVTSLPLTVQLDSAACQVILFKRPSLLTSEGGWESVSAGDASGGKTPMYQRRAKALTIGSNLLRDVMVMAPTVNEENDSDGLLPTNLFQSVYISHSGGYAIFNPVTRTLLAKNNP